MQSISQQFEQGGFLPLERFSSLYLGGTIKEQILKIVKKESESDEFIILDHYVFSQSQVQRMKERID